MAVTRVAINVICVVAIFLHGSSIAPVHGAGPGAQAPGAKSAAQQHQELAAAASALSSAVGSNGPKGGPAAGPQAAGASGPAPAAPAGGAAGAAAAAKASQPGSSGPAGPGASATPGSSAHGANQPGASAAVGQPGHLAVGQPGAQAAHPIPLGPFGKPGALAAAAMFAGNLAAKVANGGTIQPGAAAARSFSTNGTPGSMASAVFQAANIAREVAVASSSGSAAPGSKAAGHAGPGSMAAAVFGAAVEAAAAVAAGSVPAGAAGSAPAGAASAPSGAAGAPSGAAGAPAGAAGAPSGVAGASAGSPSGAAGAPAGAASAPSAAASAPSAAASAPAGAASAQGINWSALESQRSPIQEDGLSEAQKATMISEQKLENKKIPTPRIEIAAYKAGEVANEISKITPPSQPALPTSDERNKDLQFVEFKPPKEPAVPLKPRARELVRPKVEEKPVPTVEKVKEASAGFSDDYFDGSQSLDTPNFGGMVRGGGEPIDEDQPEPPSAPRANRRTLEPIKIKESSSKNSKAKVVDPGFNDYWRSTQGWSKVDAVSPYLKNKKLSNRNGRKGAAQRGEQSKRKSTGGKRHHPGRGQVDAGFNDYWRSQEGWSPVTAVPEYLYSVEGNDKGDDDDLRSGQSKSKVNPMKKRHHPGRKVDNGFNDYWRSQADWSPITAVPEYLYKVSEDLNGNNDDDETPAPIKKGKVRSKQRRQPTGHFFNKKVTDGDNDEGNDDNTPIRSKKGKVKPNARRHHPGKRVDPGFRDYYNKNKNQNEPTQSDDQGDTNEGKVNPQSRRNHPGRKVDNGFNDYWRDTKGWDPITEVPEYLYSVKSKNDPGRRFIPENAKPTKPADQVLDIVYNLLIEEHYASKAQGLESVPRPDSPSDALSILLYDKELADRVRKLYKERTGEDSFGKLINGDKSKIEDKPQIAPLPSAKNDYQSFDGYSQSYEQTPIFNSPARPSYQQPLNGQFDNWQQQQSGMRLEQVPVTYYESGSRPNGYHKSEVGYLDYWENGSGSRTPGQSFQRVPGRGSQSSYDENYWNGSPMQQQQNSRQGPTRQNVAHVPIQYQPSAAGRSAGGSRSPSGPRNNFNGNNWLKSNFVNNKRNNFMKIPKPKVDDYWYDDNENKYVKRSNGRLEMVEKAKPLMGHLSSKTISNNLQKQEPRTTPIGNQEMSLLTRLTPKTDEGRTKSNVDDNQAAVKYEYFFDYENRDYRKFKSPVKRLAHKAFDRLLAKKWRDWADTLSTMAMLTRRGGDSSYLKSPEEKQYYEYAKLVDLHYKHFGSKKSEYEQQDETDWVESDENEEEEEDDEESEENEYGDSEEDFDFEDPEEEEDHE